jgi:hexosaminidase
MKLTLETVSAKIKRLNATMIYGLFFSFIIVFKGFTQDVCPVLPIPSTYIPAEGELVIEKKLSINEDGIPEPIRTYLINKCKDDFGLITVFTPITQQLVFKKIYNVPNDFYRIRIDQGITIQYSSEASCFYALTSLFQLMVRKDDGLYFKKCFISDAPKHEWRAMHLDVCRNFFSVNEVKRFIDLMALYKMNTFHWQLSEKQTWRIALKSQQSESSSKNQMKDVYSVEDLNDVVAYASERYITVIPEFQFSRNCIAINPAYLDNKPSLLCLNDVTLAYLKTVFDEISIHFPSPYIHLSLDEDIPEQTPEKCFTCQNFMHKTSCKNEADVHAWFIKEIQGFLTTKQKKIIVSGLILNSIIPEDVIVMSQQDSVNEIEVQKNGRRIIRSPLSNCYFDTYQSRDSQEPEACNGYLPLEQVFSFEPIPYGSSPELTAAICGARGSLRTRYIKTMNDLEYMLFPRMIAFAQVLWSHQKPSYEQFMASLVQYHFQILNYKSVNYSKACFYPEKRVFPLSEKVGIRFCSPIASDELKYRILDKSGKMLSEGEIREDTLFMERTTGKIEKELMLDLSSKLSGKSFRYPFTSHPCLSLPITFLTPPLNVTPQEASFILTNGERVLSPKDRKEWVSFDTKRVEMQLDLGKYTRIIGFHIGFINDSILGFYKSKNITVLTSKDGVKWKQIGMYPTDSLNENQSFASFEANGRYVKLLLDANETVKDLNNGDQIAHTCIDELILYFEP